MKFLKNHPFIILGLLFISGVSIMSGLIFILFIPAHMQTIHGAIGAAVLVAFSLYYYICYILRSVRYEVDLRKNEIVGKFFASSRANPTSIGTISGYIIFVLINRYNVALSRPILWGIIIACHAVTIVCLEVVERFIYPRPAKTQAPSENKMPHK